MPQEVDQHGLPVPGKFEDSPTPARSGVAMRPKWLRWALGLLLVAILAAMVVESRIGDIGRGAIAQSIAEKAVTKYDDGDLAGAIDQMGDAISWMPDDPRYYYYRGHWRLEADDIPGAIADETRVIELMPTRPAMGYQARATIYQRKQQHAEAIADWNQAVEHREPRDPQPFNGRAYARATAGVELEGALEDVEKALTFEPDQPAYLDTRGYLYYLLGKDQPALEDLDRAISLFENEQATELARAQSKGFSPARIERMQRSSNEGLAVMYHHRGQVHERLGHAEQAQTDLSRGQELGYNPAAGVY